MAKKGFGLGRDVFRSLGDREIVAPYLKNAMLDPKWPAKYTIEVDSSPYYGLGDGYFHPSTHGLMDERRLYYQFHPKHRANLLFDPHDFNTEMTFAQGTALHAVVQTQLQMAKILRPENVEKEFIIVEHHVRGRTDMVVDHPTEGMLPVELKTQNARAFAFQDEIKESWNLQLNMALYGLGYSKGVLLVLEAARPFRTREFIVHRDDELLARTFAKFDYVRECVKNNTPPPHCCSKGSKEMKECPAKYECWLQSEVKSA